MQMKEAVLSLQNKTNPLEREQSCLWVFEAIREKFSRSMSRNAVAIHFLNCLNKSVGVGLQTVHLGYTLTR